MIMKMVRNSLWVMKMITNDQLRQLRNDIKQCRLTTIYQQEKNTTEVPNLTGAGKHKVNTYNIKGYVDKDELLDRLDEILNE